jgi:hypothetical protein
VNTARVEKKTDLRQKREFRVRWVHNNEEVEISIREWLRVEGPSSYREIIFYNSWVGFVNVPWVLLENNDSAGRIIVPTLML